MNTPLFKRKDQLQLLNIARSSIEHGLSTGQAIALNTSEFKPILQKPGASFVTLEKDNQLRGCIGSVEAYRPLVEDVAENSFNAAFRDPRFTPMTSTEFPHLHVEISILTQAQPIQFKSEADLKQKLIPGQDGLIMSDGRYRGLFLPAVWEKLPDVNHFLAHLKLKAGLRRNYWSETIKVERFHCFEFSDDV